MVDWLDLLEACSQRVRERFLDLFGSVEAGVSLGVGAGGDITRRIDMVAEEALTETLRDHGVSCTLVSEEAGVRRIGPRASDVYLTVDPVDGTTNALRGLPFAATSMAVSKKPRLQEVEVGLVMDLFSGVTYTAERGRGTFRDGEEIRPSSTSSLREAIVGIDFDTFRIGELITHLTGLLRKVKRMRHLGANALEICFVADGKMDAFIELREKLRVTDAAAAYLILQEAGGLMVTPEGAEMDVPLVPTQRVSFIAAANKSMYKKIAEHLAGAKP